jgi:hypothetical protein
MDADTRHQLKTNELAEVLATLRDLKNPRFLYPAGAVALVAIAVLAWLSWRYSQRLTAERDWERLGRISLDLSDPDASRVAAAQSEARALLQERTAAHVRGYARLELARSLVAQGMAQPDQRAAAFDEAVRLLEQTRSDPAAPPLLNASSTFLLATTCESQYQFDRAKQLYQSLADDTRSVGSPYKALAEDRLTSLDTLTKPVVFTPGEPPAPPPPATQTVTLSPQPLQPPLLTPQPAPSEPIILRPVPGPGEEPAPAPQTPPPPPPQEQPPQPEPTPQTPEAQPDQSP